MTLALGIKSDPIEYRYSYEWLFGFMRDREIRFLQLGSFFELYHLEDEYFRRLRGTAESYDVRIKSCFTAHRELGGFFTGIPSFERVARRCYERFIEVASILGADYVGSNPGAVYRDTPERKTDGIDCYVRHMRELVQKAHCSGLRGLTVEPMSSLAEPPSTMSEISDMILTIAAEGAVYVCGDVSHGLVAADGSIVTGHEELFEHAIPMMVEFHLKNTDAEYHSTFGFGEADRKRGIVDLQRIRAIVERNADRWPVDDVVAYLEIGGPKLGRDFSDPLLASTLDESIDEIRRVLGV